MYESSSADMEKLSYPVFTQVGEELDLRCPSLGYFNKTDRQIEWYKVSEHMVVASPNVFSRYFKPSSASDHVLLLPL